MTIIGVDPGESGGIAWHEAGEMRVEKMPETLADLWELVFRKIACRAPKYCIDPAKQCLKAYIEQVGPMPKQGVVSVFKFGRGYGNLEMALTAASIPFERVTPQKWQKAMGCMTRGDKNVSKRKAQELFPQLNITHATADAALIAEYGRRQNVDVGTSPPLTPQDDAQR